MGGDQSDRLSLFLYPSQIGNWELVCALKSAYPNVDFKAYDMDIQTEESPYIYDHPYNDGYTHEAQHAAHIAISMWSDHVHDTRCAYEFPDVKEAILKAEEAMSAVYQLIGQKLKDEE